VLFERAKTLPAIHLHAHAFVVKLLQEGERVVGVSYLDEKTSTLKKVFATAVLLATGGLCQAYHETTNPPFACGDGVAMAFRAGAMLSDMEFIQFHPTVLYVKNAPRYVLSEALRGEGAQLRNIDLERFMPRYHEGAELAPRDIVSRAMVMEMARSKSEFTYLDLTGLSAERIKKRFPQIYSRCMDSNIDITADLIPVRPAAHYAMGGIATDLHGITSLPGLYAAGEVAATGVHGANRLASNSLLEDLVWGARAATAMAAKQPASHQVARGNKSSQAQVAAAPTESSSNQYRAEELGKLTEEARALLSDKVGIIREGKGLAKAVNRLREIQPRIPCVSTRQQVEEHNILEVARLIAQSALAREESRGAHYRSDFPLKHSGTSPQHSYVSKHSEVSFE
jgi:L-aspartate oxidase